MCEFPKYKSRNRGLRDFSRDSRASKIGQACCCLRTNKFRDNKGACCRSLSVYRAIEAGIGARVKVEVRDIVKV